MYEKSLYFTMLILIIYFTYFLIHSFISFQRDKEESMINDKHVLSDPNFINNFFHEQGILSIDSSLDLAVLQKTYYDLQKEELAIEDSDAIGILTAEIETILDEERVLDNNNKDLNKRIQSLQTELDNLINRPQSGNRRKKDTLSLLYRSKNIYKI